jgi:hypothetical protein
MTSGNLIMKIYFVLAAGQGHAPSAEFQWLAQAQQYAVKESLRLGITHWVCEVVYAAIPDVEIKKA